MTTEFEKQEQFYLDHIIWLWSEYDRLCQKIAQSPSNSEQLDWRLQRLYNIDIKSAYEAYYRYFGHHCTYQPKLSHLQ